jgi:hypothetical protein
MKKADVIERPKAFHQFARLINEPGRPMRCPPLMAWTAPPWGGRVVAEPEQRF